MGLFYSRILVQISELRASVSRCEQQAAWREERMKQEVGDMQQRLQEAETRNQELTTSISQSELQQCIVGGVVALVSVFGLSLLHG